MIISDDHAGLRKARKAVLPGVKWQRCLFHLSQNAMQYAPKLSMKKEIAQSIRDVYQAPSLVEAKQRLTKSVTHYEKTASKFSEWLEENLEEGLTFYQFPEDHWKKIRTNNLSERLNQEFKRRTKVARLFPSIESCERLITAVAMETHEDWMSGNQYLSMEGSQI